MIQLNVDDLTAIETVLQCLNDTVGDNHPLWPYVPAMDLEEPESNKLLGKAVWHGDGYWVFEPKSE